MNMEVKAIRNFWHKDTKRGAMVERKKGDGFTLELNETSEKEDAYSLIMEGRVTVIDERFVPKEGEYTVLRQTFIQKDGRKRRLNPGEKVAFPQEEAVNLMVNGSVKPSEGMAWRPVHLLRPVGASTDAPKRMFDDGPAQKENWVTKGVMR